MGDFLADSSNGPTIFLTILIVDIVVVGGSFYLVMRTRARRVVRRAAAVFRRVMDEDRDGARAIVAAWDRGDRPKDPFARLHIANAWSMVGEHGRALSVLESTKMPKGRLGRSFRRNASELRYQSLKGLGENDRAEWFLRDSMVDDPSAPWLGAARSREAGGTEAGEPWQSPVKDARKRSSTDDARALSALAQEAFRERRFVDAAELQERLLGRVARSPTARFLLPESYLVHGATLLAAGRDGSAETAFNQFVRRSSDRPLADRLVTKTRAETLLLTGRVSESASAYEWLAADRPTSASYAGLAMCRVRFGDPQGATDALDQAEALGLDPDEALPLRAQILVDQGRAADAERIALEVAGDPSTTGPGSLYTLAYVRATAHLPGAEGTLRRYAELQPNDPDLAPLLDRAAPGGGTWRERIEVAPRPDVETES